MPGVNYRLWVAFNKPMRIRNSSGAVVSYAGQSPGAAVGTVTLEIPSLTGQDISLGGAGTWLNTPGGAPNGYLHYSDDAFAANFSVPNDVAVTAAMPAVLFLNQVDLSQMALDGDPGSAADWGNGAWLRYEDTVGVDGDVGGADCTFKPFVAPQAGAAPPAAEADCRAAAPPPPPDRGGGGGEGSALLLLLLGLLTARDRRRTQ